MSDDYSNYPMSIGEMRAEDNASRWTPRECLINLLRMIDSGEVNPDCMVIAYREKQADGETITHFHNVGPDMHTSLGVLEAAKMRLFASE